MAFSLTPKQIEAQQIIAGYATHVMLFGGSRSGKTFLHTRNTILRALKAPKSRHAIFRYRLSHIKATLVMDTFPRVMTLAFPGVICDLNKSDLYATFENGSEIWFGGLDDRERTEKILGSEYATIYLNECSQIPQSSRDMAVTKLAQRVDQIIEGRVPAALKPRMYYDENPPTKGHWTHKLFIQKIDPDTRRPLHNPADYAAFQMNPIDNMQNLAEGFLDTLRSLSARMQKRFLAGEFSDATPNALFAEEDIDRWRVLDGRLPDMIRLVVAVDPSGSGDVDNADNDAIGIIVAGLGTDGNAYVLEDCTVKAGPATWGKVSTDAYERHAGDVIVGEVNFGGAMVQAVISSANRRVPFKAVTSSRGKVLRAEPVAALYAQGKVRHVGQFRELEDELMQFSTVGYLGERSPNRADSLVFAVTELFPGIVSGPRIQRAPIKQYPHRYRASAQSA